MINSIQTNYDSAVQTNAPKKTDENRKATSLKTPFPGQDAAPVQDTVPGKETSLPENEKQTSVKQKAPGIDPEMAREVAKKMEALVSNPNIRFVVRDPNSTGPQNVVIEVLNENDKVVARIPEDVVNQMVGTIKSVTNDADNHKGIIIKGEF